jgi:hypothetical protein
VTLAIASAVEPISARSLGLWSLVSISDLRRLDRKRSVDSRDCEEATRASEVEAEG